MDTFTIELNAQEAEALLRLIDLAVRGGGMQVAEAAVVLSNKIRQGAKPKTVLEGNGREQHAAAQT